MIPKRIIYCNFGNIEIRENIEKLCIDSWKKIYKTDEYEYFEVNETNFDVNMNKFTKYCYEHKLYAYVADYARFWALYTYGGIYFDTDVLAIKEIDEKIRSNDAFIGSCEYENKVSKIEGISVGVIGSKKNSNFCKTILNSFNDIDIEKIDIHDSYLMKIIKQLTYSSIDCKVYPFDYFTCAFWHDDILKITTNSYCVHLYGASWTEINFKNKRTKTLTKIINLYKH